MFHCVIMEIGYMTKFSNRAFSRKPLVVALAAVLTAPAALAGPFTPTTPGVNQLPGDGTVLTPGLADGKTFTPVAGTPTTGATAAPAQAPAPMRSG